MDGKELNKLESAMLNTLIEDAKTRKQVLPRLNEKHIQDKTHASILRAITALSDNDLPIDMISVRNWLQRNESGKNWAVEVATLDSKFLNDKPLHYATMIIEASMRRQLRAKLEISLQKVREDDNDVFDIVESLEKTIEEQMKNVESSGVRSFAEIKEQSKAEIASGLSPNVVFTGLPKFDELVGGFKSGDLIILAARPAMGKALGVNEGVLTPKGFVPISSLKAGDDIMNTDGGVSKVMATKTWQDRPIYRVSFSNGASVLADIEHDWLVSTRKNRKKGDYSGVKMSTRELIEGGVLLSGNRKNYAVEMPSIMHFEEKPLGIDPYLLGLLLGDGSLNKDKVYFCNIEDDLIDFVAKHGGLPKKGDGVGISKKSKVYEELKRECLLGTKSDTKFIPDDYIFNSEQNRLALLRGLIDTDGYLNANDGWIEYSTTSNMIARQIKFIVSSLGGWCTIGERKGRYKKDDVYYDAKTNYRVHINFDYSQTVPYSSAKHLSKHEVRNRKVPVDRVYITSIDYVKHDTTVCIQTSAKDSLFITNGFIPTHNSGLMNTFAKGIASTGVPVYMFSLEMEDTELIDRMVSGDIGVDNGDIVNRNLNELDRKLYLDKIDEVEDLPIFVYDKGGLTLREVKQKARLAKQTTGIGALFVDYIQLMNGGGNNRHEIVGDVSRGLKALAKELEIPIIALAQLSRRVEEREFKLPQLSDLKESGDIEQDADKVFFIWRPSYYGYKSLPFDPVSGEEIDTIVEESDSYIRAAKNRRGIIGTVRLDFQGRFTRFV